MGSLRFSLAHLTLLKQSPPELIDIAAAAGYEFVGLRLIPFGLGGEPLYELQSDPRLLRETRRALRETGVRVLDMELARIHCGADVKQYLPALLTGAELGARHVLTSVWSGDAAFVRDQFAALCELAAPLRLTVDLEYVPFAQVRTLAEAASLVSAAAQSNAGLCIDTLHFDRAKDPLAELSRLPPGWFHYAQICDGPAVWSADEQQLRYIAREARLCLGDGGIDVWAILQAMPQMPYSIELPNAQLLAQLGPIRFARRCLDTARRYMQEALPPAAPRGRNRTLHTPSQRGL